MTTLNEITYVDWQYKLNKIGSVAEGVEDINQCIAIILLTQKGSDPLRPTFGSDIYKYIDYPINSAKATVMYVDDIGTIHIKFLTFHPENILNKKHSLTLF